MTTYYISGPMTGIPGYNHDLFCEVEADMKDVKLKGDKIVNPALNFDGDKTRPRSDYLKLDIAQVLQADVIVLLPGWEKSEGANLEVAVASACGKSFKRAEKSMGCWLYHPLDAPTTRPDSPRASALAEATQLITGDRNAAYGPPTQDFARTAEMAGAFGFRVVTHEGATPTYPEAHHVAIFMILLKMSRLAWSPLKRDSWVDTAGYAGCGYECAVTELS